MPLYWRNRYQNFYRRRRRRRPLYRRRFRKPFQRRFHRRYWVRRKRLYKTKFKRKLKKIPVRQWQPQKIVKCKIKGELALFIAGKSRVTHDFTLYKESITPTGEASGGAWSIQQITLDALYTEFTKYRNYWTRSNTGLPFARYTGCKFKFFKSPYTDYIVTVTTCPPFSVTLDMFLNTQPQRMLFEKRRYIIPQLKSATRKRYKTVHIKPPSLMQSKWFFQRDICKTPLCLITTTACSLEQPYCPENQISYNLTLYSLNTEFFQNPNFETFGTQGYIPKEVNGEQFHIYKLKQHQSELKWKNIIPIANTYQYQDGSDHIESYAQFTNKQYWGNPFTQENSHPDVQLYYGTTWPSSQDFDQNRSATLTELHELYWECRYNPEADKGIGNMVYLKSNNHDEQGTIYTLPNKEELIIKDYPLWLIFWGYIDFLKKSNAAQQIDTAYMYVVRSPYITPKKTVYLFLDRYFVFPQRDRLTDAERLKWHPMYNMQTEVEDFIGVSGPYAPKINRSQCIQANTQYTFYFKWGGCPAPMENITSPCQQDKFPIPDNQLETFKIQDPKTPQEEFLYQFDERRGTITKRCAERITKNSTINFSITDLCPFDLPYQTQTNKSDEETASEKEQTPLLRQLNELKHNHRLLRHQLKRLTKRQKLE